MILITGATGHVGRAAVDLLLAAGEQVTAVTRDPAGAALPAEARVIGGDPSWPATLAPALRGVEAILLSPRAVGAGVGELLALAAEAGVRRVVVLSAVTVEYGGGYRRFAEAFTAVETAAEASGLAWTHLRCADFDANALVWAPQIRTTGVVRGAYGAAATSAIHERDIAEVAALALTDEAHAGRAYALTGPRSLSQRDKVAAVGATLGREVSWEEVPPDQVREAMLAQGVEENVPDRMLGYLAACLHEPGPATDTVERLLGRPARTFADWVADHAGAFAHPHAVAEAGRPS